MSIVRIMLAGVATLIMNSAALAEQGVVTKIDRLSRTIAIQPTAPPPTGTVGANSSGGVTGPAEDFKTQDGVSLDDVHAGDRVNYSAMQSGAAKTITKLERQK
jgi:hypothetical protein